MRIPFFIRVFFTLTIFFTASIMPVSAEDEIHLGVLAVRSPEKIYKQWLPLANDLSRKLPQRVTLTVLQYNEVESALKNDRIDFLIANPGYYVFFKEKYDLQALATRVNLYRNVAMDEFGGVIFTRNDRDDIRDIHDLHGKRFMCAAFYSFGGWRAAQRLFIENKIFPEKDFSELLQGGSQDNVVMAVLNGEVDAGTVRTDTLEKMNDEGLINSKDIKIIHPIAKLYPVVHSTRLYPEWPFIACRTTDRKLRNKMTKLLRLMEPENPAMIAAKVFHWTYPESYQSVEDCVQIIKQHH